MIPSATVGPSLAALLNNVHFNHAKVYLIRLSLHKCESVDALWPLRTKSFVVIHSREPFYRGLDMRSLPNFLTVWYCWLLFKKE